jgi:hypothetical protein
MAARLRQPVLFADLADAVAFGPMAITPDRKTQPSKSHDGSRQRMFRVVLAFGILLAIGYAANQFLLRPPYAEIVDELPHSARLVRHELIRRGVDHCHVFEFSCSDATLREELVRRWQLRDFTKENEPPVSFMENHHPDWWAPDTPSTTGKFGRRDDNGESYLSIWEQPEAGRLYVEVGSW